MTAIAFCPKPLRSLGSFRIGNWALRGSGGERRGSDGKIKRTGVRELADRSAIEKPLSAHWFLEALRLAPDDV
jgi:hypothetical protein